MGKTYECQEARLMPNFRHTIIEKDENGLICGTYIGYWIPGLCSVTLYPCRSHPAWKPGFPDRRVKIYDGEVKCRRAEVVPIPPSRQRAAVDAEKGEGWRERRKPMTDQIKIDF